MSTFETETTVGPGGVIQLAQVPFAAAQTVHVRIEGKAGPSGEVSPRVLGLHAGVVWISDDFDDPLPDSFWFGEENSDTERASSS